jgi:hypothetical protein
MSTENCFITIISWAELGGTPLPFETVVVKNSEIEFAIFDSSFSPRMPILVSSCVRLGVVGKEYSPPSGSGRFYAGVYGFVRNLLYIRDVCTLKSTPINGPPLSSETGGHVILSFRPVSLFTDIKSVQDVLDVYAQDIHNMYAAKNWGELLMSVARIISASL